MGVTRFAPSITGAAHPGTLLSGLLVWLDGRSRGDRVLLRLEDLDSTRLRPGMIEDMLEALTWLGLDWDEVTRQSHLGRQHQTALDRLATEGLLYPCRCSRTRIQGIGRRAPDGGFAYDNACRGRALSGDWRAGGEALRVRLPEGRLDLVDDGGFDLGQDPAREMGDPVVLRRDRVVAYHLAVVVDDEAAGVDRIVRGYDLAASAATQERLRALLGFGRPRYRHHPLLLEHHGGKLAKLHGSVSWRELAAAQSSEEALGHLAHLLGLRDRPGTVSLAEVLEDFTWDRVRRDDVLYRLP